MGHLDFLHGGNIYQAERKQKKGIIDFSANINPLGLSSQVKKAISNNLDRVLHYPDPEAWVITQKIAQHWGIGRENIIIGNGSVEFIYLIAFTYRPKLLLIPAPSFSEYERAGRCVGSQLRFLELDEEHEFKPDLTEIGKTDLLFLCNPNNPTGNLVLKNQEIKTLPGRLLVIDEAFMDFLPDEERHTLIRRAQKDKKIIVIRTFTKFYALPGLRIGYLVAHKETVQRLKRHQVPWSVNSLAQLAGEYLLDDREYHRLTLQLIDNERFYLFNKISNIKGLKPYPAVANFLLIKIKNRKLTSGSLAKELLKKGILIRDCSNFRNLNNKFIRIAVRSRKENEKLISAFKDAL
jgi:threonine-phosphate decarboxylase